MSFFILKKAIILIFNRGFKTHHICILYLPRYPLKKQQKRHFFIFSEASDKKLS